MEADLKILRLQEEIVEVLSTDDDTKQCVVKQLLRPEELMELCLKSGSKEVALQVFDVFEWTSSSFLKSHRTFWKSAGKTLPTRIRGASYIKRLYPKARLTRKPCNNLVKLAFSRPQICVMVQNQKPLRTDSMKCCH